MRLSNSLRWLILAPAVFFAFWPTIAQADPQPGLATTYYTIDEIPPLRSTSEYPICGTETENNINRSYDGEPFEDCTGDLFMVQMTGYIDIPEHTTIEFWLATDDGGYANIGGNEFESWNDQGCSWIPSGQLEIEAGIQPLEVWMYENGGGTCVMLAWNIDDEGWSIVPDEAFTRTSTPTTTTSTSTTVPETTTTSTTTTEPATTTTEQTTTTTTTVYVAPATTTTTTVYVPPATTTTTTTEPPTTTTSTTTTTTEPPTTTTESTTTTTQPEPTTTTTQPEPTTTTTQAEPTTTTTEPEPEPLPETSTEEEVDEFVEELLADVTVLEPEQIVAAVEQILATTPTTEQATQLATTSEVLAAVTEAQAEAIFEAVVVEELSVEQGEAIVDAVQEAPKKVREAFEAAINVFTGLFDSYVMVGSTIPVEERRTLVAVSSTMVAVGASLRRRNN
jgi:hypothetical protein